MAQSGYTPILIYASGTTGNTPSAGNLTSSASGAELALNYFDGKLFYKDSGGTVRVLATKGTGTIGGSNTQVQFNNNGALGGSANMTWDGTYLTATGYKTGGNIFQNAATVSSWDSNWNAIQGSSGSLAQLSTGNDIRLYLNLAVVGAAQKYVANGDASALIMQGSQLLYTQYASGTAGASATSTTGYWKFVDGKFGVGYTSAQTPPAALSTLNGSIAIQNTTTSTNTSVGTIKAYSDYSGSNYLLGNIDFSTAAAADNGKMTLYTGYAGALSYGVQLTYGGVYLFGRGAGTPANVYLAGAGNSSGVRDIAYMWYSTDAAAKKWATVRVGTTGTALDDNSTLKLHSNVNGTTYDTLVLQNNAVGFNVTPSGTYGIEQSAGTSTSGSTAWSAYYGMASSNGSFFGNGTGALYGSYTNVGVAPVAGFSSYLIDGGSTSTNYGGGAIISVKQPSSASMTRMWYFDQYGNLGGASTVPPGASAHGFFPGSYGWFGDDSGTSGVSCHSGVNIYNDGNWRARVTGPTYSTLYQQNSADGSHNWYASTSTTAGGSVVSSLALRAALDRSGNLSLTGSIIPSYTEYTVSITGVAQNTWTTCINTGVLVTGGYYWVSFRWDHGGSGQPYIVSGAFMFTTVNTNGTGGDNEFLPLNATHTGSGTSYNISFRAVAGTASTTGMQYKLNGFTGNGNLRIRMYYFGAF